MGLLRFGPYGVGMLMAALLGFAVWGVQLVTFVESERAQVSDRVRTLIALKNVRSQVEEGRPIEVPASTNDPRLRELVALEPTLEALDALAVQLRRENGVSSTALGDTLRNLSWLIVLSVVLGVITTVLLALSIRREDQLNKALIEAARAREQAQAADQLKDRLLANVAHELRTPLARVLGLIELAKLSGSTEDLGPALVSGRQLARLLGDLLDLAALQSGSVSFRIAPTDVGELLQSLARDLSTEETPVVVRDQVSAWLATDEVRLKQVVRNLISNAARYAPGHPIEVDVHDKPGWLTVEVHDRGPGFDGVAMLEPFVQQNSDRDCGLGLGLAIVNEIIACWSGELERIDRVGGGTTMRICIPVEEAEATFDSVPHTLAAHGRVLVVEDDPTLEIVVRSLLVHLGYEVETVDTGEAALVRLTTNTPPIAVAILDWHLPGISGPEVVRELRARGVTLPMVAVTARARHEDVEHCLEAGFNEHLAKPIDSRALRDTLSRLL